MSSNSKVAKLQFCQLESCQTPSLLNYNIAKLLCCITPKAPSSKVVKLERHQTFCLAIFYLAHGDETRLNQAVFPPSLTLVCETVIANLLLLSQNNGGQLH